MSQTFEAHGKTWTKHETGSGYPCNGEKRVFVCFEDGTDCGNQPGAVEWWEWDYPAVGEKIIGWRYADESKPEPSELEKLRAENEELKSSQASLLNLLADIRAAVGDPHGKLMQDELVQHCRDMREAIREAYGALQKANDPFCLNVHEATTSALAKLKPFLP